MPSRLSPYPLWALLSVLPLMWIVEATTSDEKHVIHNLLVPTGEWAARLLILALMITPLAMLFPGNALIRWLRKNRRYFGVAAFAYAALHAILYLIDKPSIGRILGELSWFYIWTGWLAFAVLVPLAATSTDSAVRVLGRRWKQLQRGAYVAAVLTLVHWVSLYGWQHPVEGILHFAPLAALEAWRFGQWLTRRRASARA